MSKKIQLMTHVVVGYPTLQATKEIVLQMVRAGVDYIELQIPFSDPMADGPVIMKANDVALANGVKVSDCLNLMEELTKEVKIPLLFMSYYQIPFHYGVEKFCQKVKQAGAYGLIIPDIPLDEESNEGFIAACEKYQLHHIRLLSPSSTEERIQLNAQLENGFVYCTSRTGTTGTHHQIDVDLADYLRKIKKHFTVPVAVGFGISKPEHIKALEGHADIAVVGSAVIEQIEKNGHQTVEEFIHFLM